MVSASDSDVEGNADCVEVSTTVKRLEFVDHVKHADEFVECVPESRCIAALVVCVICLCHCPSFKVESDAAACVGVEDTEKSESSCLMTELSVNIVLSATGIDAEKLVVSTVAADSGAEAPAASEGKADSLVEKVCSEKETVVV